MLFSNKSSPPSNGFNAALPVVSTSESYGLTCSKFNLLLRCSENSMNNGLNSCAIAS